MHKPTDQELDVSVANMLRFGVSLAALVVLIGGVLIFRHPSSPAPNLTHFHSETTNLRTLPGILHGSLRLDPRSIVQLGLVLLIATPVARVVFCVVGFARQRSRLYVVISSLVLIILVYSLSKGGR